MRRAGQQKLRIVPCDFDEAKAFVRQHHLHHKPPVGHKFSLAVADESNRIRGVAIVGRPIARMDDNGWTLEILRVATDGCPNAGSALWRASWRVTRELGYRRLITCNLPQEGGGYRSRPRGSSALANAAAVLGTEPAGHESINIQRRSR